ncbi:MAG TPA: hypothetical protein PLU97_05230 [Candidatus Cryptobacteroides sp.]|nr:hypothetical protein [Candidatus Cryptobacteroides sp.]
MKKKTISLIIIAVFLLVLFVPIPKSAYNDGGTRDYNALAYKIVVWNKLIAETNEDGSGDAGHTYHKTSVFWFPDNFKSIDELWKIETNGH